MISSGDTGVDSSDSEDFDYVPSKGELDAVDELIYNTNKNTYQEAKTSKKRKVYKEKNLGKEISREQSVSCVQKQRDLSDEHKVESIWKSFLGEVHNESDDIVEGNKDEINRPAIHADVSQCNKDSVVEKSEHMNINSDDNVKMFEFAGETLIVKDDADDNLKIAVNSPSSDSPLSSKVNVKHKGTLNSVLGAIVNKKQKLSTLEKSFIDWESFKKDEGIEDELKVFNRGKGGFIERQRFLERSDLRSFETEKTARLSKLRKC